MIHFWRNKLYRHTACGLSVKYFEKDSLATTHTIVSCPQCISLLIKDKEAEVEYLKERYEKFKNDQEPDAENKKVYRKPGPKPGPDNQLKLLGDE